jgi:Protein of unknown function (DUF2934)
MTMRLAHIRSVSASMYLSQKRKGEGCDQPSPLSAARLACSHFFISAVQLITTVSGAFGSAEERAAAIAELAYRFWEERGRPEGSPEDDWYRAELIIDQQQDCKDAQEESLYREPIQSRKKAK